MAAAVATTGLVFEAIRKSGLVRFCPICDGFEFTDQRIGVIGSGEHGVKEVEFIRNYSSDLTLIDLDAGSSVRGDLHARLEKQQIKYLHGSASGIAAAGEHAILVDMEDGPHQFDTIYCALGSHVRSELALEMGACCDKQGCLQVNAHLETSIPGLFAAGDVVSSLDQLAVAAGQAAIAATAIHNRLLQD